MALKLPLKVLLWSGLISFSSITLANQALDFSHARSTDEIYNYEQYLYDPNENNVNDLYENGRSYHNRHHNQDNFEYGRDRYYGQERPYPNRPICPYNDGTGHHKPHPNCPEYNYPQGYPNHGHFPSPPYPPITPPHPEYPKPPLHYPDDIYGPSSPAFKGSVRACIAFEKADGSYSRDYPITVDIVDRMMLADRYRIFVDGDYNNLFVVFYSPNLRIPNVLPMLHRKSLGSAATVLSDLQGHNWRISRTWKRCTR